ncbi:MAG: hypothetical protein GY946_08705, partial [bacterium]|nr:hypothetical protein [bacterium]
MRESPTLVIELDGDDLIAQIHGGEQLVRRQIDRSVFAGWIEHYENQTKAASGTGTLAYAAEAKLLELGQEMYSWLNGETHWIEQARTEAPLNLEIRITKG